MVQRATGVTHSGRNQAEDNQAEQGAASSSSSIRPGRPLPLAPDRRAEPTQNGGHRMTIALSTLAPSARTIGVGATFAPLGRFLADSAYARRRRARSGQLRLRLRQPARTAAAGGCVGASSAGASPRTRTGSPTRTTSRAARGRRRRAARAHGLPFEPEDIFLTNGAFAALAVAPGRAGRSRRRGDLPRPALVLLRDR